MRNKYEVFGLVIESPIHLPEARQVEQDVQVDITINTTATIEELPTDEFFLQARKTRSWWQATPTRSQIIFNCNAGLFDIQNGTDIYIDLYPDANQETAKIFLLGSAMGAVQIQRGRIPIHGGAVVTPTGAMIITGGQGSGKSTMTSAFVHNGYKYITDDVSSIIIENEKASIIPAYPQRKLVRDACLPLGYDPEKLIQVDSGRDKFAIRELDNWQNEKINLSSIIELYPDTQGDKIKVESITGHQRLNFIFKNLYRAWMHYSDGDVMPPADLKKILIIASQTDIYRISVPRDITRIAEIAQNISVALEEYK